MSAIIDFENTTIKTRCVLALLDRMERTPIQGVEDRDELVAIEFMTRLGLVERFVEQRAIWGSIPSRLSNHRS
jgi:hypothetical protein